MEAMKDRPFQVMAKPIGPRCNLDCKYCYYLEKEKLYPETKKFEMQADVLETYIRDFIASQVRLKVPEIWFNWQGGEPTILGLDYFRQIVALQKRHAPESATIRNALQTNGMLLDEEWAVFLKENGFLVGISIDGPQEIHDAFRYDKAGRASFKSVMRGYELLKSHGVEHNILTVVHRENAKRPLEVYRFLKAIGAEFIQFIPIVERSADGETLASAPQIDEDGVRYEVTPWSVLPRSYSSFLTTIFDEWVTRDVGSVFVQFFDMQLGLFMGKPASLCVFAETCGQGLAMEHNGDLYACDHYVYPQFKLGNITETPVDSLANSALQQQFGDAKRDTLTEQCRTCDIRFACNGGCPKHRFLKTKSGEPGLNYFCRSTTQFVKHARPYLETMVKLLDAGRPASDIMRLINSGQIRGGNRLKPASAPSRNAPCPCGSGRKFKHCCGA
nr:anaerobic sulfatase maturase [uncultured Cohaesibacter sp.]